MSLIALAFATALAGQEPSGPQVICDEDDESIACEVAERARLQAQFGVASAEDEALAGGEIFRAFLGNGYGRDMLVVSFESRPNQSPTVVVSGLDGRRIAAPVAAAVWDRVVHEAVNADRDLLPLLPTVAADDEESVVICIHAWSALVEMTNAYDARGDRHAVRRKGGNTCEEDNMATGFGFLLADLAVNSFPACAELEPTRHRNNTSRLEACLALAGNTVAAASLMNEKGDPPRSYGGRAAPDHEWKDWLTTDMTSRMDWAGEVSQESNTRRPGEEFPPRLVDVMIARAKSLSSLVISQSEIGARDSQIGWIVGQVSYYAPGDNDDGQRLVADYRQEWSRGGGFGWRMDSWTVGPFRPLEPLN